MPSILNLCHSCKKYRDAEHFSAFKNILNRRCKTCVVDALKEKYENNPEAKPYVLLLRPDESSSFFKALLPTYRDMHAAGLVENLDAAPYMVMSRPFRTRDIDSVVDRIHQMKVSDFPGGIKMNNHAATHIRIEAGFKELSLKFESVPIRKLQKQIGLSFPFIRKGGDLEMLLFKTEDPEEFERFKKPRVTEGLWDVSVWRADEQGSPVSEVY